MSLSIAIAGVAGRMGRALIRAASSRAELLIVGGTERAGSPAIGQDLGVLAGVTPIGVTASDDVRAATSSAEAWIDFSTPTATLAALEALNGSRMRVAIIGTTGFAAADKAKFAAAAHRMAVVRSGNFSLGVNLLAGLAKQAAQRLGKDWDVEIVEAHHRRKLDAPSGTALMLGEAVAEGRGEKLDKLRLPSRDGMAQERREGGIGFSSVRGGGLVGRHDVMFAAEREVLTLAHEALDRAVFADGALVAALWAAEQKPGLYSMKDVLGL